jgi:hypothetical protein
MGLSHILRHPDPILDVGSSSPLIFETEQPAHLPQVYVSGQANPCTPRHPCHVRNRQADWQLPVGALHKIPRVIASAPQITLHLHPPVRRRASASATGLRLPVSGEITRGGTLRW